MMATFVAYARGVEHVQFEMLDPLNEPDWDGLEGPKVGAVQYTRLLHKLATRLDAAGYGDVRFLGPITDRIPAKGARIQELVDSTYKSFLGEVSANCR